MSEIGILGHHGCRKQRNHECGTTRTKGNIEDGFIGIQLVCFVISVAIEDFERNEPLPSNRTGSCKTAEKMRVNPPTTTTAMKQNRHNPFFGMSNRRFIKWTSVPIFR